MRLKKILPILFLFVFWFVFASPFFLKGKVPFSSTYQVNFFPPWSAYPQFGQPVKNNAMPDVITQIYPWRHVTMDIWKSGQIPLWNPYSFAGTPLLANYQSGVLSPLNILFFIFPFVDGWSLLVLLQPLLAGLFTYLYARQLKLSEWGSVMSSMGFMFCGFIVAWMGYATLGYAILFLPLALYAIEKYLQSSKSKFLFLLVLTFPLSFFSGHFQISLYFFATVLAYTLFHLLYGKQKKASLSLVLCVFFGLLLTLPQVLPSVEFYGQSLRSTLFQRGEVIPWQYLPTLLAPDFYGNAVTRNDWFGHYAEWNMYIGVLPFLLSLYAIRLLRNKRVLFFFAIVSVCLLLAFPTPLGNVLVWLKIPVLATSAASRIISVSSFFLAILAGFGLDKLREDIREKKRMFVFFWIGLGVLLFAGVWGMVIGKIFLPVGKVAIAKQNLILPTVISIGGLFSLSLSLFIRKRNMVVVSLILLLALTAFDVYRFATKWQSFDPKSLVFPEVGVTTFFKKISGYQRAWGKYDGQASVYYKLPSLEGYDALYPKRYGEFLASLNTGIFRESERSVVIFPLHGTGSAKALNLLNVAYLVHKRSDDNVGWTYPYWNYPEQFHMIFEDASYRVFSNMNAFPHMFISKNYLVKKDPQQIIDTMFDSKTDLRNTVILEEDPHLQQGGEGKVDITSSTANTIKAKIQVNKNSLVFLSDTFYPGWVAFVDGKQTPIYRADYAFRAIVVPSGTHNISFLYQPLSFALGIVGSIVGLAGLLVLTVMLRLLRKS